MAEFKLNNAVDLYYDGTKRFETKVNGAQVNGTTLFIRGGSGEDSVLQFIANNSASYNDHYNFRVAATGAFSLQTEVNANQYENLLTATQNGAVELYHDNLKKFETTNVGAKVTHSGAPTRIVVGSTDASGAWLVLDGDSNGDGAGSDYAYIEHNASGHLNLINPVGAVSLQGGGVNSVVCQEDAEVVIYHNGNRKFETLTTGVKITGNLELSSTYPSLTWTDTNHNSDFRITNDDGKLIVYDTTRSKHVLNFLANGDLQIPENKGLYIGESNDLLIAHDGSLTRIVDTYGHMKIASNVIEITNQSLGENYIKCTNNAAVDLYYDASTYSTPKLSTSTTGITVDGEVAASQDYPQSDPNIDFVFTRAKKLDPRLTYRRTGTASYVDKNGMIKMVGDNVPRFDHDPLTKECKGLLLEPASSNRIHSSTSGIPNVPYGIYGTNSNANSDKSGFSADTLAPDGSKWTQKVSWKDATFSTNGYYRIGVMNMGTFDAGDYTVSTFVKRGIDGNHNLDTLFAGTSALGSSQYHVAIEQYSPSYASASANWVTTSGVKIQKFQNGWYRISVPLTVSSSYNPLRIAPVSHYVLNSSGHETYYKEHDWYYWGMQIEPGDVVTSYMGNYVGDSTNSTGERLRTQRGADCLFMDGQEFKDFYNVAESSIVMQYTLFGGSTYQGQSRPFKISAQTGSDTRIDYVNTNQYHPYIAADGNAVVGATGLDIGNVLYNGQTNKIALKVKHQDFASTLNGGTVATNTSGSWPPTNRMDLLTLGALNKDGGGGLKGHIQRFTYYPVGLTNNQLVTLTS